MTAVTVPEALKACLEDHFLLRPESVLAVAVSGGCDSMALLHGLYLLSREHGFSLHAIHVQHGLRGGDSLADEQLVRRYCEERQIPLRVHNADLGGDPSLPGMETRARECRRAFFEADVKDLHAQALLTAHHRDDQTETVLMHLLRGAGANGLSGMKPCTYMDGWRLLRPFLELPKAALRAALEGWGIPCREDDTNHQPITLRNALRLQVLPLLEQLSPGCGGRIAQAAALARIDEYALSVSAQNVLRHHMLLQPGLHALAADALIWDKAVALRALRRWYELGLERAGLAPDERSLSAEDSLRLLHLIHKGPLGGTVNLPMGLKALLGQRLLHLVHQDGTPLVPAEPMAFPLPGQLFRASTNEPMMLYGWWGWDNRPLLTLSLQDADPAVPPGDACTALIPEALLPGCVLRTPEAGDRIHPLGAPGAKPLRRWLTDHKIERPLRAALPVVARGRDILWIPGLCTAQALAYTPDTPCLQITIAERPLYLPTITG